MRTVRKVLVVDDDPVVGRSFDRVLSEKGYEVSTALSGTDAMHKLARDEYDVVFTDIKMPGMDGLEVAGLVKQSRPWVPVVIITGYGTAANEARAEAIGVADFLRKPLSPEMIEGSTRKALRVIEGGLQKAALESAAVFTAPLAAEVTAEPIQAAAAAGAAKSILLFVRNVALFLAAPFIGLAYAVAFPFIGLALLVRTGAKAWAKRSRPE
jgi:DNA-binding NtrC family response regulator